ncbi:MAG: hypothetical protein ACP5TK_01335 [Candidatus Micrarchaeia archaeon]
MIYLSGGRRIALDERGKDAYLNFISHAHEDHLAGLRSGLPATASRETIELIKARKGVSPAIAETGKGFEMLNAGHVLGSRQLYFEDEYSGVSYIYTGDFQMQENELAGRIEIRNADIAIIDSTYPFPNVHFDERTNVIDAIQFYARKKTEYGHVIFSSQVLGKAQELIKIFNEIGLTPVVSERIGAISNVYERFNIKLDYITADEKTFIDKVAEQRIGITENNIKYAAERLAEKYNTKVYTAIATGLAKSIRFGTDVQFALSDHADFRQTVKYIDEGNFKYVFTKGKNAEILAYYLRKAGYDAEAMENGSSIGGVLTEKQKSGDNNLNSQIV